MSLDILKKELKNNIVRNIYLLYGPESYLLGYYAGEIKSKAIDAAAMQVNYTVFEDASDVSEIVSCCMTAPFFAEKKMIVLKNTGILKPAKSTSGAKTSSKDSSGAKTPTKGATDPEAAEKVATGSKAAGKVPSGKKKSGGVGEREMLSDILEGFPNSTCLLIIEETVDKRLRLFKDIAKYGLVAEFQAQPPYFLDAWARNTCAKEGKSIEGKALNMLLQKSEPYMQDIKNELNKLLLYIGDRASITAEDVGAVCTFSAKTRVFDLINTLTEGNKLKAWRELNDLLSLREPVQFIIIMISKHFISLRQLKSLALAKVSLSDATALAGLNPYAAKIMWRQCLKYDISKLDEIVEICHQQDNAIKTGEISDESALDILIATI